jgi:catechol 2,3-dioxygenase-like lactoylglutathione lyase family enzyme
MVIELTSIYVDDQRAALAFYTDVLGFLKHHDIPLGEDSWLTVVSTETASGPQLLLEPAGHPAVKPYRDAPGQDGIPSAQFAVVAVFDDTCGNLIQLITQKPAMVCRHPSGA